MKNSQGILHVKMVAGGVTALITFGELVSKRMDEILYSKGMSLYGLAKKTDLPLSSLKNLYTRHTKSPTILLIYRICDGLDISIEEFLDSPHFSKEIVDQILYN